MSMSQGAGTDAGKPEYSIYPITTPVNNARRFRSLSYLLFLALAFIFPFPV